MLANILKKVRQILVLLHPRLLEDPNQERSPLLLYSDVLRRHELTHRTPEPDSGSAVAHNPVATQRQRRAQFACDRCARYKIRCNGRLPCIQCLQKSLACTLERPRPGSEQEKDSQEELSIHAATQLDTTAASGNNPLSHMSSAYVTPSVK